MLGSEVHPEGGTLMRRARVSLFLLAAFLTPTLFALTTGSIVGRVTDDSGGGLPGVTVAAKGHALQGT